MVQRRMTGIDIENWAKPDHTLEWLVGGSRLGALRFAPATNCKYGGVGALHIERGAKRRIRNAVIPGSRVFWLMIATGVENGGIDRQQRTCRWRDAEPTDTPELSARGSGGGAVIARDQRGGRARTDVPTGEDPLDGKIGGTIQKVDIISIDIRGRGARVRPCLRLNPGVKTYVAR
jgi:hypothetical protein